MSLPLLVRPNTVIPIGSRTERPDYDYSDDVTLQVYQLEDGKQVNLEISALNGKIESMFSFKREENIIHVQRQGATKAWNILLVGIDDVENLEKFDIVNGSVLVKLNNEVNELTFHLGIKPRINTDEH